jgi:hypothetical protein
MSVIAIFEQLFRFRINDLGNVTALCSNPSYSVPCD